jgi:hypothetical protein
MILHRVIDVFFRTLDAVDTARDQLERVLGRESETDPWAVPWSDDDSSDPQNAFDSAPQSDEAAANGSSFDPENTDTAPTESVKATESVPTGTETQKRASKKRSTSKATASSKSKSPSSSRKKVKKSPGRKKSSAANRKGSVDRSGKDVDSARARAIENHIREHQLKMVTADDQLRGKKVLARVVWALWSTEQAGAKKGLTTKDISALLSACANIEVFTTNIGRACRDHAELIYLNEPDGRSKRYSLTEAGHREAQSYFENDGNG